MNPREALLLPYPQAAMIETTGRCNASCVMCPQPQIRGEQSLGDMDESIYAALLAELATFPGLRRVMLYLRNEPLLDPRLVERIQAARAALPQAEISLLSNGVALTDELSERLLDAGLTWIGFSLHAARAETYRAVAGRADFARVRAQITRHVEKMLRRFGPDSVMINATRIRPYVGDDEWREIAEYWRGVGLPRLDRHDGYISRAGNVAVFGREPAPKSALLGCGTVWAYEMAHVLCDGSVVPCCMDYRRRAVWGNVRDAGLLAIWRGPARRAFLERMDGRPLPPDDLCLSCEDALDPRAAVPAPAPEALLVLPPPWLPTAPPLGLAALAAWVEREGFAVDALDANIDLYHAASGDQKKLWEWESSGAWGDEAEVERRFGAALRELARRIAAHPAPLIGFSLTTVNEIAAAIVARETARLAPARQLIAGGPGAAAPDAHERFRRRSGGAVRCFVVGEGEQTFAAMLARARDGASFAGLPGTVVFDAAGRPHAGPPAEPLDPATLPPPDYRRFDLARYRDPALFVEWSRGCTGACAFCNVRAHWRRYRAKPAEMVLAELGVLRGRHSVEWLGLADPIVNGRPDILEAICDGIVARGWKLRWAAAASPNHPLTPALLGKMRAAGCYRLELGVESGSDRVLAAMKKRYSAAQAARLARDAHAAGLEVVLYLVVGFPGETTEDFAQTLRLVEDLAPAVKLVRSVNSVLLLPGAELDEMPEKFGVEPPDRARAGWEKNWRAGELTAAVRAARAATLIAKLRELGTPVEFSNRAELGDEPAPDDRVAALERRLAALHEGLRRLTAKSERTLGGPAPPTAVGRVALAICPVWGVDMPPYAVASLAANLAAVGLTPAVFDFNIAIYRQVAPELRRFWEEDSFRHWTDLADWRRLRPHLEPFIQQAADRLLASERPIIGFSVYSPNRQFTIEVCKRIKAADPRRTIVVGGRGVDSPKARRLFPPDSVDWFVVGEGERALAELAREIERGGDPRRLPFVDFFAGPHLGGSPDHVREPDPGALAPPDYAYFDLRAYRSDELPLLAGRGCTGHCAFCNDHEAMGPLRPRPGRQVAAELLRHQRLHGVRRFRFNDQLINGDLAALEEMCDALIEAGADVEWLALAAPRGDMPDRLLAKMRRAGCATLNLGVESGADNVLRRMAKGFRAADMEKALVQIHGAGIRTMVNFVVGFPNETEEDFAQTLEFVRRCRASIDGVNSVNTCLMLLDSPLEKHRDQFHLAVPTSGQPDTGWVHGKNTPAVRAIRARRLLALLDELGLPARVSNLHERVAELEEIGKALDEAAGGAAEARLPSSPPNAPPISDPRSGLPRYEPIEKRDVDALLIMAPVWGVDAPPLGIAYVQSYLQAQGIRTQCLDLNIKFYNRAPDRNLWLMEAYKRWTEPDLFEDTLAALWDLFNHYVSQLAAHPARILGFSVNTGNFSFTRALARQVKALRPDRPIVFGGPGITNSYDIVSLTTAEADYLVLGEGEKPAAALFRALLKIGGHDAVSCPPISSIPSVVAVAEPFDYDALSRTIFENLEEVDWPRLEDFDLREYAAAGVPILGSRGCIRRCSFCNDHHLYQKYRRRPAESVAAEMNWHADQDRKRFTFHDVLINGSIPELEKLCDLLIAGGRELRWGGQGVIRNEMTPELFAKLAAAGCESFVFGVESFSDAVLKSMNKPYTAREAAAVLTACRNAGIQTNINLIVGFLGEGEAEFRETYDFVRDHGDIIDQVASITPCLINLGSRLFDRRDELAIRFPDREGSMKWHTDDGNTFDERRRRVLALTTLLAGREHGMHTVNLYDETRGALPEVAVGGTALSVAEHERPDLLLALPPPWGVEFPPLSLAMLAGAARAQGWRVAARDLNAEWRAACGDHLASYWRPELLKCWSNDGRLAEIVAFLTPQIKAFLADVRRLRPRAVGFSTNESNLPFAAQLAERVKHILPQTAVLLGGPGVHWEADRRRIGPVADACLRGEGEIVLPNALRALAGGGRLADLPGVAARANGGWSPATEPEAIRDLDALPPPDFSDLPLHLYATNQFPLQFGRGCVNRCHFCNDHQIAPGYRALSPERLLDIVRRLKKTYGAFAFSFNDLLVNADLSRLRRFCELAVAAGERFAWTGQCLARREMTAEDYRLLRRAGCVSLSFGVESFSDDVLQRMGKRFDVSTAREALRRAKEAGIATLVNLIVGFPGETEAAFAATEAFVRAHAKLIDRVGALSTCIVVAQCPIEKDPAAFGVVLPEPEHWRQWRTADDANTYRTRVDRLRRLARALDDAGIPHGAANLYEEALDHA